MDTQNPPPAPNNQDCCDEFSSCACRHEAPRSLDWSDMLALACRQLGKFAVYGNYTTQPNETDSQLQKLCERFFVWCDNHGIEKAEQDRILQDLLTGRAALFDTSEEAGRIFRFFLEKGVLGSPWFACLVSPTEGIAVENT